MKQRIPNPRILCCASIFALSFSACTHHPANTKTDSLAGKNLNAEDQLLKVAKKGHRYKKNGELLPDPRSYDNLWDRLFDRFELPEISHQDIDRELNWFMNHPTYIERVQSRAEPFLYSIVKQLEKKNLPGELALLPVIESAFQPHAVSPANAAGIWQFIPATGHRYGLKRSPSYDGRRDIYASTRAAIKYLKKLHNDFNGDWLLAIAGYNCGEGAVARAIQRNQARGLPTDFWSLDLPQETRSYVPRLLAVAKLFSDADQYGIALHPIPNHALYKTVKLNTQVDLALAANAADIPLDRLMQLNPGFKRQRVDVEGSYRLFIPAHKKIVDFKEELARQIASQSGYEVDYQATAASAAGNAAPSELQAASDFKPVVNYDSKPVAVPAEPLDSKPVTAFAPVSEAPPEQRASSERQETNKPEPALTLAENTTPSDSAQTGGNAGDNWQEAAVEVQPLAADGLQQETWQPDMEAQQPDVSSASEDNASNRKSRHKSARQSHEDSRSVRRQAETDNSGKKARYLVQKGDTLFSIARRHNMDVEELKKMNHLPSRSDEVLYGQTLMVWDKDAAKKLTIARTGAGFKPSQSLRYTVREGETLFSVSRRFNVTVADLRKWNGIKADNQFRAGMNITVLSEKN